MSKITESISILDKYLAETEGRNLEQILFGKKYLEAPIIASRICGRSSVAHTITSCKAIENACDIPVSSQTEKLREMMLAAEIIKNHTDNLYCNILPNFVGAEDILDLEKTHAHLLGDAMALNSFVDEILKSIGGRVIHPVAIVPGGFLSCPKEDRLKKLVETYSEIEKSAKETLRLFSSFDYPKAKIKKNFMALHQKNSYSLYDGEIWTSNGVNFPTSEFRRNILEQTLPHNDLKSALMQGHNMSAGPTARLMINKKYPKQMTQLLSDLNIKLSFQNPFDNIIAATIESYLLVTNSRELLSSLLAKGIEERPPGIAKKFGTGAAACESAAGTIFHSYELDSDGNILKAEIITPSNINFSYLDKEIKEIAEGKDLKPEEKNSLIDLLIKSSGFCAVCAKH